VEDVIVVRGMSVVQGMIVSTELVFLVSKHAHVIRLIATHSVKLMMIAWARLLYALIALGVQAAITLTGLLATLALALVVAAAMTLTTQALLATAH
jgi:hypothetical protein